MSTKAEHFEYLEAVRTGGAINMWGGKHCVYYKFNDVSRDESAVILVEWFEYKASEGAVYEALVVDAGQDNSSETLLSVVRDKFPEMRIDFALIYVELFRRDVCGIR